MKKYFPKFSAANILKAGKSTFIGAILALSSTIIPMLMNGSFNIDAIVAGVAGAVVLSLTDMLSEVKKEISND